MHPLFRIIATEPALVADHLQAYGELMADEALGTVARWRRAALLQLAALACAAVALTLAGVAAMLWVATAATAPSLAWVLVAVPSVPAVVAWICHRAAGMVLSSADPSVLRDQWAADAALLRSAAGTA